MNEPTSTGQMMTLLLHPVLLAGIVGLVLLPYHWAIRWGMAVMLVPVAAILSVSTVHFFGLQDRIMDLALASWSVAILGVLMLVRWQLQKPNHPEYTSNAEGRWVRYEPPPPVPDPRAPWPDRADMAIAAGYGIVLAVAVFWRAAWFLDGASHGYLWHAGFGIVALGALAVAWWRRHAVLRTGLISFAAVTLALTNWGAFVFPAEVRANAEKVADGAPYCIDLNTGSGTLQSMGDLSFLTMPKPKINEYRGETSVSWFDSPHLVIERSGGSYDEIWKTTSPFLTYSWAQAMAGFIQTERYDHVPLYPVECIPRLNSLQNIPSDGATEILSYTWDNVITESIRSPTFNTEKFRVPAVFQADTYPEGFSIKVRAPDFVPEDADDDERSEDWAFVDLSYDPTWYFNGATPDDVDIETMPRENGLHHYRDDNGIDWYADFTPSVENPGSVKDVTTAIRCGRIIEEPRGFDPNCTQFFQVRSPVTGRPILLLYFNYHPELLPQWREMQAPLTARIMAFLVED